VHRWTINGAAAQQIFVRIFALTVLYMKIVDYLLSQFCCTILPFANDMKMSFVESADPLTADDRLNPVLYF
jgi:hypothetical protein